MSRALHKVLGLGLRTSLAEIKVPDYLDINFLK